MERGGTNRASGPDQQRSMDLSEGARSERSAQLGASLDANPQLRIQKGERGPSRLSDDPNAKVVSWAETFTGQVQQGYVQPAYALPVSGMDSAWGQQRVARGGARIPSRPLGKQSPDAPDASPKAIDREVVAEYVRDQENLTGMDPEKIGVREAAELGRQAAKNRVLDAIQEGGAKLGASAVLELRKGFAREGVAAQMDGRPRDLEQLIAQGVVPQAVLPGKMDVQQAYLKGMEDFLSPREGRDGVSDADRLVRDVRIAHLVVERAHVQGLASVRGLVETGQVRPPYPSALYEHGVQEALAGVPADRQRAAADQILAVLAEARVRHAQAVMARDASTLQRVNGLSQRAVESPVPTGAQGAKEFRADRRALEAEQKGRVQRELNALGSYLGLRLDAIGALENADRAKTPAEASSHTQEAFKKQEQAVDAFYRVVERGGVSPETLTALHNQRMDPATLFEQVQGVHPTVSQQVMGEYQLGKLRDSLPARQENLRTFLFRQPGGIFKDPLPVAAYDHQGQTHLAVLLEGRPQHGGLEEALGDPDHALHSVAIAFENALAQSGGIAFKMSRNGFRELDPRRPGLAEPSAPVALHLGGERTPMPFLA